MSLDFPLLVRSRIFFFFFCLGGGKGAVFLLCFCPLSREGNSGLHSTPSNYSSFYGIVVSFTTLRLSSHSSKEWELYAEQLPKHKVLLLQNTTRTPEPPGQGFLLLNLTLVT